MATTVTVEGMEMRIRNLSDKVHEAFRILCIKEKVSMNLKLQRMIRDECIKADLLEEDE